MPLPMVPEICEPILLGDSTLTVLYAIECELVIDAIADKEISPDKRDETL
jgi:hypothetical protein